MKDHKLPVADAEPVGIVISRGSRAEPVPTFLAFEWGPAPEDVPEPVGSQAA